MERKPIRFEMRLPPEMADAIDVWRSKQDGVPNRAEAARRLIDTALKLIQYAELEDKK